MPIANEDPAIQAKAKVKTVKIKTKMTGLILHVEGDPHLCVQALKETLALLSPDESSTEPA
jgi:hypothetical protein